VSTTVPDHRYEDIVMGMDAAVFAIDGSGTITVANPALEDLFQLDASPVGEPYIEILDVPQLQDAVNEALEGRSTRIELDLPGPSRRIAVAYASPQKGGQGAAVQLRDITGIRHLERVRRDFLANVSHELRTPVSVIQASAETLLNGALEDSVHSRNFVHAIERHAGRMSRIIQGLLDLARLEAGQRGLARERVNVRAAALRAMDLTSRRAESRQVEVRVDVAEDDAVFADTKGVDQIMSNLVQNAVKYCGEGGTVTIDATQVGKAVRLTISDDGPGIKEKHRPRVFERFYRVDKGRSRDQGGTGLGLAIVKHLTHAMGGNVGVEPNDPIGSTFWVSLPRFKDAKSSP
jgi:two-component system phosphate regulon sensor histidine kinase PhoR